MLRPLLIVWQEGNDTGIALIDEQHRGICSIINTFYYLVGTGKGDSSLYSCIIDTLYNYSSIHFATEEEMLKECEYEGIEKHKEFHKKLLLEMEMIKREVSKANDPKPLYEFLKKWWLDHINSKDRRYVPPVLARYKTHYV